MKLDKLINEKINWTTSSLSPYIFEAKIYGELIKLRLNDFPEEVLCTLISDAVEVDLEEFPKNWTLPKPQKK